MNPSPRELVSYVTRHYPEASYVSAYEAGFSGFWIHEQPIAAGFRNMVVHPGDIPTTNKERTYKDDRRDAGKLARALEKGSLEAIYVPSKPMQQIRSLWRLRFRLVGEQTRYKNRIKSHLALYGHPLPEECSSWSGAFLSALEGFEFQSEAGACYLRHSLQSLRVLRSRIAQLTRELRQYARAQDSDGVLRQGVINVVNQFTIGFLWYLESQ